MITPTMYPEHQYPAYLNYLYLVPFVLLTGLILFVFVSCAGEKGINDKAEVTIEMEVPYGEKLLSVSAPSKITAFEYKATPGFVQDEDLDSFSQSIVGDTKGEWKSVRFQDKDGNDATVGKIRAVMGYYQQGRWTLEIRALNANGNVVYYGTTGTIYLNSNRVNAFSVEMHGVRSEETETKLKITFTGLETEEGTGMRPAVTLRYLDNTTKTITEGWTEKKIKDGVIEYSTVIGNLDAGEITATVSLSTPGGVVQTAETFKTVLIDGETTVVTGTLESGAFDRPGFEIEEDKSEVKGSIEAGEGASKALAPQSFTMTVNTTAVFTFVMDENADNGKAYSVKWYVAGIEQSTGNTYAFSPDTPGNYYLTASVTRGEKAYSTEAVVVVMEGNS